MRRLILIKAISVKGHTRSDGTVVQPYTRQGNPSGLDEAGESRTLSRYAKVAKLSVQSQGAKHRLISGGKPASGWMGFAAAKAEIMERTMKMDNSKVYTEEDAKLRSAYHRKSGREEKPRASDDGPKWPAVAHLWEKYDGTGEVSTAGELADEVENLIDAGKAPDSLQHVVNEYRSVDKDQYDRWGGRDDMHDVESALTGAIKKLAQQGSGSTAKKQDAKTWVVTTKNGIVKGQFRSEEAAKEAAGKRKDLIVVPGR